MAENNQAEKVANAARNKMSVLEEKLEEHSSKLPKLSKTNQNMFSNFLPWAGGAFGVLLATWTMDLWDFIKILNSLSGFSALTGNSGGTSATKYWIVFVVFVLVIASLAWAFYRGVVNKSKEGWTYFYYAFVTSVIGGLLWIFLLDVPSGRGMWTLVGGLAGLYIAFQVKNDYTK